MPELYELQCDFCGRRFMRRAADVLRGDKGPQVFCDRKCFGKTRRVQKSEAEKKAEKAEYDRQYRAKNRRTLKRKKARYFQRTYDPVAARKERRKRMARHVEYCRKPEYKKYKRRYDATRRSLVYGEFSNCHKLLLKLESAIEKRATKYERMASNGTLNKALRRKRALIQDI